MVNVVNAHLTCLLESRILARDRSPASNDRLRALLDEARWTHHALARAVNVIGAETGRSLHYHRSAVTHWLSGTRPQVPDLIAEAFTRKLNRVVTPADLGVPRAEPGRPPTLPTRSVHDTDSLLGRGDPIAALAALTRLDTDPAGHHGLRHLPYRVHDLDIPDWSTAHQARPTTATSTRRSPTTVRTRVLGSTRQMLEVFAALDHCFGGGHARTALITYLAHDLAAELRARDALAVHGELHGLAADLTYLAGFRCFDHHTHGLAQRYYRLALAFAVHAGDPIRYAIILCSLSHQARYLGHYPQALSLARRALAATAGTAAPRTEAFLHAQAALCHAAVNQHHHAHHHQHQAEHHLAQAQDPAPILGAYDPAECRYHTAHIHLAAGDLDDARTALRTAIDTYPGHHRRSRALALALLTDLHLATGRYRLARASWQHLLDDHDHLYSARVDAAVQRLRCHVEIPTLQIPRPRQALTDGGRSPQKRRNATPATGTPQPRPVVPEHDRTSDTAQYQKYPAGVTSAIAVRVDRQELEATSDISGPPPTAVPAAFTKLFADYARAVSTPSGPLDPDTVRAYRSRVRQFLAWLADTSDAGGIDGDPLTDPHARNGAVRDYRTHLRTVAKRKLSTVNAHLTAIDDFYRHLGLGPAMVKRQELPKAAPRALPNRARTRWLRAAQRADPRGKALAYIGYHAGLRSGEAVALDLDDVRISAREGVLIIRYGKGGQYREVPLRPQLRTALQEWITDRAQWPCATENPAVFLNRRGGRLTTRGAYDELKKIAIDANLEFGRDGDLTPHALRHTAGTNMIRGGQDIVTVAKILGHSIETARRYSLPTEADKQAAIERLAVDE
nr:Site-specific recombinase XerD [Kibdelosporangium sp. MJ126-NF4]CTQ99098.1 Site-specific recombinase XerD [Kibdelosporangium sp. MJ126-NF4]